MLHKVKFFFGWMNSYEWDSDPQIRIQGKGLMLFVFYKPINKTKLTSNLLIRIYKNTWLKSHLGRKNNSVFVMSQNRLSLLNDHPYCLQPDYHTISLQLPMEY